MYKVYAWHCSGLSGCHKKAKWTILLLGHVYSSKMERQINVRKLFNLQIKLQIKNIILDMSNKWDNLIEKFVVHFSIQFHSVQLLSHVQLFATPWIAALQASLSITNSTPRVSSNSCPLSRWCHPAISPSVVPFSSCTQSLPASGSFPMNQLFAWGGQSIGVSASASVLPMNTQDWSPLGWTGWIFLQSKGLTRVFSSTTVQSVNSSVLSFLHSPTLTSIHDHWKNHSLA